MKIFKFLAGLFFLACLYFSVEFLEPMLNPKVYFGSNKDALMLFSFVIVSLLLGVFFLTRGESGKRKIRMIRYVFLAASVLYAACLIGALFVGDSLRTAEGYSEYSLVPFRTIRESWNEYRKGGLSSSIIVENIIGNLVLFIPAAWFLPLLFKPLRKAPLFAAVLLAGIIMVEVLQHITSRGVMDIDDVILNFLGAIVVFFIIWNRKAVQFMTERDIIEV